jgi:hypothetical protein
MNKLLATETGSMRRSAGISEVSKFRNTKLREIMKVEKKSGVDAMEERRLYDTIPSKD